ncbi:unnamed protein product [Symbiodinium necroappetens]|uniref:Uncharacterized protein n=1 Tax=Symbiodinium necroappetens TaxID=1628268 RepID=A0A813AD06_9DINO|nr:unnamed protein product [Symbiodinium necroappetens]
MLGCLGKPLAKPLLTISNVQEDEYTCARCKWTAKVLRAALGERRFPRRANEAAGRRKLAEEVLNEAGQPVTCRIECPKQASETCFQRCVSSCGEMPVWQNINLKQKAIFEIIQRPHARDLPYYLTDDELDFFVKGIAWGPHKETYLPRLVERHKRPIYIARGYAPPTYSRLVMIRYYGPDPLLEGYEGWDAGEEGEIMQYVLGWRWIYADWPGPLVDEVEEAWKKSWWPEIARPDWTWEGLRFCVPPYHLSEEGLPWREGRAAEYEPRVTKGKGKGRARALQAQDESRRELGEKAAGRLGRSAHEEPPV